MQRPQNEAKWNGPYLQKAIPLDPWGKPYQYKSPGERGEFDLWSSARRSAGRHRRERGRHELVGPADSRT